MDLSAFLRLFPLRAPRIMWFLGAGASAGGGVPTAAHLIWRFKRDLYCSAQRVPLSAVGDLADERIQTRLQAYFESQEGAPARGSDEEYSYFFELAYPKEEDRRAVIEQAVAEASPSFGHRVMGAMIESSRIRVVWTTNFDPLLEDAATDALENQGRLIVASTDAPGLAQQSLTEERYPLLVKLHGDFRSRRLRNTTQELKEQDRTLRESLTMACSRFGLAVVGYSGRDQSVMKALRDAVSASTPFPSGLFWFHRTDSPLSPAVIDLMEDARGRGVDAQSIQVETFDELFGDIANMDSALPAAVGDRLAKLRPRRLTPASIPSTTGRYPALRMNAFPITQWPEVARLVSCSVGGVKEVRKLVADSGAQLIAARRQRGVIAFGSDQEIAKAFGAHSINALDLYPIEPRRLRYDSQEHGLLYEALARGLARRGPLVLDRWRRRYRLSVDPNLEDDDNLGPLKAIVGALSGQIESSNATWAEAVQLRLEYRLDRLWVIADPSVALLLGHHEVASADAKEFVRARLATRYNSKLNALLDAWAEILFRQAGGAITPFDFHDGVNASFVVSPVTGFSWREEA